MVHWVYELSSTPPRCDVVRELKQRAPLDFAQTIGTKSDIITVLGSAPLLNTSNTSVSAFIGDR